MEDESRTSWAQRAARQAHRAPGQAPAAGTPRGRFRWAWWLLAYVALGLGLLGVVLPGLPTVPFILLSAWAAAQGSERLHAWLLAHPKFGTMIRDWHDHGAITRKSKWLASGAMLASAALLLAMAWLTGYQRWWAVVVPIGCMAVVGAWLWMRPEPPPR